LVAVLDQQYPPNVTAWRHLATAFYKYGDYYSPISFVEKLISRKVINDEKIIKQILALGGHRGRHLLDAENPHLQWLKMNAQEWRSTPRAFERHVVELAANIYCRNSRYRKPFFCESIIVNEKR